MNKYYYEVWSCGYVRAKNEREATKKINESRVIDLKMNEEVDQDVTIEIEEDDE